MSICACVEGISRTCRAFGAMASSLASTLTVPGGGFRANSQLRSTFVGVPFLQLPLQQTRVAKSSCHPSGRRPLLVAAVGGSSSEPIVEDQAPSTSSSAEVRAGTLCWFFTLSKFCGCGGSMSDRWIVRLRTWGLSSDVLKMWQWCPG